MSVYTHNIEVFKDTRHLSNTEFKEATKTLKRNTAVIAQPSHLFIDNKPRSKFENTEIRFTNGGTVSTAYAYAEEYNVAALNFADALEPGGLVLSGEVTQEENICRCTNLYESITLDKAMSGYYKYNQKMLPICPYYTNALIYSYDVTVFKDDTDYHRIEPRNIDVITCPSPAGGNTKNLSALLKERIEGIVVSAVYYEAEVLVLGAWGCGAFRQDAKIMARLFGEVIAKYKQYFKIIDFAIRENFGGRSALLEVFEKHFWKGYNM